MGEKLAETQEMPPWLHALVSEKFFNPCSVHESLNKNDKNILCVDCCLSLCPHCITSHDSHRFLQIRRYMYHCVVRVKDLEKLFDCGGIQSYKNNNSKVVFVNERIQTRNSSSYKNPCFTAFSYNNPCDRCIPQNCLYCSLHCKVKKLLKTKGGVVNYLRECESLPMRNSTNFDECLLSPHPVFDATSSRFMASGSDPLSPTGSDEPDATMLGQLNPTSLDLSYRRRPRKQWNPQWAPFI